MMLKGRIGEELGVISEGRAEEKDRRHRQDLGRCLERGERDPEDRSEKSEGNQPQDGMVEMFSKPRAHASAVLRSRMYRTYRNVAVKAIEIRRRITASADELPMLKDSKALRNRVIATSFVAVPGPP